MAANRFETLATWYLRFNGYFTTANFTVHPDYRKRPGGTDADILAVRFPYSTEFQRRFNFERDRQLISEDRVDFVICEVKSGRCCLNDSWRDPERQNVEYAIRWMGFDEDDNLVREAAAEVYRCGCWYMRQKPVRVRFVCFGADPNPSLQELPGIQQIRHDWVIAYLKARFSTGCEQITRENWDPDIQEFAALCRTQPVASLLAWAGAPVKD